MYHSTRRRRGLSSLWTERYWLAVLAIFLSSVSLTAADDLFQSYCSSQNTAETDPMSNAHFQSNGWCKTQCNDNYAIAIVQGSNCWCSNYIPADQSSVSQDCNKSCQGFPSEDCGNADTGMFGYVLLDKAPSGTAGASSSAPATSSTTSQSSQTSAAQDSSSSSPAQAQTVFNSVTVTNERTLTPSPTVIISTVTDTDTDTPPPPSSSASTSSPSSTSSPPPPTSSSSPPTSSAAPTSSSTSFIPPPPKEQSSSSPTWTPTPVTTVQVVTISNTPITQTVTSMPTVPPDQASNVDKTESRSVSGGLIAGIVIATVIASLVIAAALFFCWRRRKQRLQGATMAGALGPEAPVTRPTRNLSVLSRTGLLEKVYPSAAAAQKSNAISRSNTLGPDGSGGVSPISEKRNSRPLFYDQRLNPTTLMDFDNGSRVSVNTLPDSRDFSRTLNITNPDLDHWD